MVQLVTHLLLPSASELMQVSSTPEIPDAQSAASPEGAWSRYAQLLFEVHFNQWDAEDDIRQTSLPDRRVVELKRKIDNLNLQRSALIEKCDALAQMHARTRENELRQPVHSESIGTLIDRLVIAHVRAVKLSSKVNPQANEETLGASPHDQQMVLHAAYDCFRDELSRGSRWAIIWKQHKVYGAPDTK